MIGDLIEDTQSIDPVDIVAKVFRDQKLKQMLDELWEHTESVTNIVTSSPVPRRPMLLRAALNKRS